MGNTQNPHNNCSSQPSPIDIYPSCFSPFPPNTPHSSICLSHFRNMLQKCQCFYVLSSLLQQYYSLFKQYRKVVVSDQLCVVTKLGELKVDFCINGRQTPVNMYNQIAHSFVTIVAQILQTVSCLALEKSWLDSQECSYFQQKITQLIYRHHAKEDRMYQELLQEINLFMENSRIKCNLIGAIIRLYQPNKVSRNKPFHSPFHRQKSSLVHSRSHSQLLSQVDQQKFSQLSILELDEPSTVQRMKDTSTKVDSHVDNINFSCLKQPKTPFRHKVVRTEGEAFFNNMESSEKLFRNHETYLSEMPPTERLGYREQASSSLNNNHISAQYSLHILNISSRERSSKAMQKVKFKHSEASSVVENGSEERSWVQRQQGEQFMRGPTRTEQNSRVYTRSVLDDLARPVEVKDQPSSRSYIF